MAPTLFEVQPKPGDLIEIERTMYSHWAVYIGNNEVVHLLPPGEDLLSMMDSSCAVVRRQRLSAVAPLGFRVNNLLDGKYAPRRRDVIVAEACKLLGRTLHYDLREYNCEHFATSLRYGKRESRQVKEAEDTALALGAVAAVALGAAFFAALLSGEGETKEKEREKRNRQGRRY
ncbi:unnamed protein product [Arctogadus glacialis]